MALLHQSLRLYISDSAYTVVPEGTSQARSLVFDRVSNEVKLGAPGPPPKASQTINGIAGIFGLISLVKSDYLVVIKAARKVTSVLNTNVFTPTSFAVYPMSLTPNKDLVANANESYLLALLKSHLDIAEGKMFFTYVGPWDITSALQRQSPAASMWEQADDRFFWNKHLQARLISLAGQSDSAECGSYIIPVILAVRHPVRLDYEFLELKTAMINSQPLTFGLISRRSRHRAGTRYFSRGIDDNGNVSNFNETEMLLFAKDDQVRASFVQTRGSVPVYWTEINNLRYKPDLQIMDIPATNQSIRKHFDNQVSIYGDQYLVNLVNKSGYEKAVKEAYEKGIANLGNSRVHYTYFDFHHECKGLRFDRVQLLIDRMEEDLVQQGYFYQDGSRPARRQTSVVRSNCMDCLDRTNVVQSALAKWMLTDQLRQAGILGDNELLDQHTSFMFLFRNVWADNADAVSNAYSGTGALKTDYTRLGVRTKKGALQDGVNSAVRYLKNNFFDGPRQDTYDLISGAWQPVNDGRGSKLLSGESQPPLMRLMPYALLTALLIIWGAVFPIPVAGRILSSSSTILVLAIVVAAFALVYIMANGVAYINAPRLLPLSDRLTYEGPGHRSSRKGRGWPVAGGHRQGMPIVHGSERMGVEQRKRLD